jgi:GH25 family lysozyme M1 (1,4-beta-N-acetylmuramidase)
VTVQGIDASAFSGNLDWDAVARDCGFVCLKGTDGINDVDRTLLLRANNARRVGLGAAIVVYHFGHVRHGMKQDADEQAKQAMDAMAKAGGSEMWLDIEMDSVSGGQHGGIAKTLLDPHADPDIKAALHDEVRAFAELFVVTWEQILGGPLVGYSSPGEMATLGLDQVSAFTSLPLALAEYIAPPGTANVNVPTHAPKLPTPYTSWRYWQYGGNCPRYGGNVDLLVRNDAP